MFSIFKFLFPSKLSHSELNQVITKGAFLVDVRTPQEYSEGSVVGAINIPLNEIVHNLTKFDGKNHIVVFCRSGNRSSQAKNILEQNGFTNVVNGGTWHNVQNAIAKK
jgi:phage shock protein E